MEAASRLVRIEMGAASWLVGIESEFVLQRHWFMLALTHDSQEPLAELRRRPMVCARLKQPSYQHGPFWNQIRADKRTRRIVERVNRRYYREYLLARAAKANERPIPYHPEFDPREFLGTLGELEDVILSHLFLFIPEKELILVCNAISNTWQSCSHLFLPRIRMQFPRLRFPQGFQVGAHDKHNEIFSQLVFEAWDKSYLLRNHLQGRKSLLCEEYSSSASTVERDPLGEVLTQQYMHVCSGCGNVFGCVRENQACCCVKKQGHPVLFFIAAIIAT